MEDNKEQLLKDWMKHKKAETKAKAKRNEVEAEIEKLYGTDFEESSKTFKEVDLKMAVNIKKNVKHSLDQDAWRTTRLEIAENLRPEKVTFALDVKGFEYLEKNEKEIYKQVSDCVTIKENKSTIKVDKI